MKGAGKKEPKWTWVSSILFSVKKNPVPLGSPFPRERGPKGTIEKFGGDLSKGVSLKATGQDQKLCSNRLGTAGIRKEAALDPALYKSAN